LIGSLALGLVLANVNKIHNHEKVLRTEMQFLSRGHVALRQNNADRDIEVALKALGPSSRPLGVRVRDASIHTFTV
jgi:hypothetical protein